MVEKSILAVFPLCIFVTLSDAHAEIHNKYEVVIDVIEIVNKFYPLAPIWDKIPQGIQNIIVAGAVGGISSLLLYSIFRGIYIIVKYKSNIFWPSILILTLATLVNLHFQSLAAWWAIGISIFFCIFLFGLTGFSWTNENEEN